MTGIQKKTGLSVAFLLLIGMASLPLLNHWRFSWNLAGKKKRGFSDLAFEVSRLPNGKLHPTMKNKPANLLLLDSHPEAIEPELESGQWLVLVYSIYNPQDILMMRTTATISQRFAGRCRVAIRPTKGFEDLPKWLPESDAQYGNEHPVWFALEDGKIVGLTGFHLSEDEINEFVDKSFPFAQIQQ